MNDKASFVAEIRFQISWWAQVDSNHRPRAYQARALTTWAMSPFSYYGSFLSPSCSLGGDDGNRTHDPLLAGQVLSQLSYTPILVWDLKQLMLFINRSLKIEQHESPYSTLLTIRLFGLYLPWIREAPLGSSHVLHRKEVIQPHLPIRLPCYDLTPIIEPTFDCCLLAVSPQASGVSNFHGLTGGVYKARERIHRGMLIRDY